MRKKYIKDDTLSLFQNRLENQLDPSNLYYKLAANIPWQEIESSFSHFYSDKGRPAKDIRLMVSLLLLKQIENLSDERVVEKWKENPYWQYFGGNEFFDWHAPCDPSEFVYFRKRIGVEGVEKILSMSIKMHNVKGDDILIVDTTVQPKNITFPTDAKLYKKSIDWLNRIAKKASIKQRQTYVRISKKFFLSAQRGRKTTKGAKLARASVRKLKDYCWSSFARIA